MWKFEVYEDKADEWRWRLKAANGEITAVGGEGYTSEAAVKQAIARVGELAADEGATQFFEDRAEEWRWRLKARNHRIVAHGGEGYASKSGVQRAVVRFREEAPKAAQAFAPPPPPSGPA